MQASQQIELLTQHTAAQLGPRTAVVLARKALLYDTVHPATLPFHAARARARTHIADDGSLTLVMPCLMGSSHCVK
jgi:hypothetical protein